MRVFAVPGIFWVTVIAIVAGLSLSTLIGRAFAGALPYRLRSPARFYLAPVLGLACLTIMAGILGRNLPLGNSIVVPCLIALVLGWALSREQDKRKALRHCLVVSAFGLACAAGMLGMLYCRGGFNAHNDAFTYLSHANWLQEHVFGSIIPPEAVDSLTTQVSFYQRLGLRMGGSFLLALFQSLFNLRWSYEIYPAVSVTLVTACCLSIGFPLARALRPLRRHVRLGLLALPAFSLGGLVFGAFYGFLPQMVGLAMGSALLFMVGSLFEWAPTSRTTLWRIGGAAIPGAALLAAAIFSYPEVVPFLLMAIAGSGLVLAFRFNAWKAIAVHSGVLFGLAALLLNTELMRTFGSLRIQSNVIVGTPVDWPLCGYVAHALGVHGGAWDRFQWSVPYKDLSFIFGICLAGLVITIILMGIRPVWQAVRTGILLPTAILITAFFCGILYFRYFVSPPFPTGMGQSWNQFKLSDWAHPFVMAVFLLALTALRPRIGKSFNRLIIILFAICLVGSIFTGVKRAKPLIRSYGGASDLNVFYLNFRATVLRICPRGEPVYLSPGTGYHVRHMALIYLYDQRVISDWRDDGYISDWLPVEQRKQDPAVGDCVVEPVESGGWLTEGSVIGPFRIGILGQPNRRIGSESNR